MSDIKSIEQLGSFYMGKEIDPESGEMSQDIVMYDAKDLTTHAVCVGMTGSGKTGLCVGLLEEAIIDNIPAIAVDLKGDLTNLLLSFPDLLPSDFEPWLDPHEVAAKGSTKEEYSKKIAGVWKNGLAEWGQDGERIARFKNAADFTVYTPGDTAGVSLSILKSFNAPPESARADLQTLRDKISGTVAGLLSLLNIKADSVNSREHILLSNILEHYWLLGTDLSLAGLIEAVQNPPFAKIGVLDLDLFYSAKDRFDLVLKLNNLLASPEFASWMEGESLDIQSLLWTADGKPRMSVLYLAHLSESERMFFMTLLLNEMVTWMRTQSGTGRLRALLYIDEVFGYLPPIANPPSKKPMLTLLKQARAFGVGLVLATQNPVDLDYKGLSNAGTWFIGRLQTDRDKQRVLDGLEGASAATGFKRSEVDNIISGLGKRKFLLHNVHESEPLIFGTRWVLSYLRGPMTRDQVKLLMAAKKADVPVIVASEKAVVAPPKLTAQPKVTSKPIVPVEIKQVTFPLNASAGADEKVIYRPALYWEAMLHYSRVSYKVEEWKNLRQLVLLDEDDIKAPFSQDAFSPVDEALLPDEMIEGAMFSDIPSLAINPKWFKSQSKALKNFLYRAQTMKISKCLELKEYSRADETAGEFRIRLQEKARDQRDAAVEKLKGTYGKKITAMQNKIRSARDRMEREKGQYNSQKLDVAVSIGASIFDALLGGGRRRRSTARSTANRVGKAARDRGDFKRSKEMVLAYQKQLRDLEMEFEKSLTSAREGNSLESMNFTELDLAPKKADIQITEFNLAWVPFIERDGEQKAAIDWA